MSSEKIQCLIFGGICRNTPISYVVSGKLSFEFFEKCELELAGTAFFGEKSGVPPF